MTAEPTTLEDVSAGAAPAEIAKLCYQDPVIFCRFFFPHIFKQPIGWFHRGVLAILLRRTNFLPKYGQLEKIQKNFLMERSDGTVEPIFYVEDGKLKIALGRFTVYMFPRGHAKTTLVGISTPLHKTYYQQLGFGVYVSEAAPHSKMQLENQKWEISSNERLISVFGKISPERTDEQKWREDFYETLTGQAMAARGAGSQVRGLLHKAQRPNYIICDDVEDKESVSTAEQRLKRRTWFYGDVIPALSELDPTARIDLIGTKLHDDALLPTIAKDPQFTSVVFGVEDVDGEPIWPEMMPRSKIEERKRSFQRAGQLHTFYLEYYNQSRPQETQVFRREFIIYEKPPERSLLRVAIYIDPAISESKDADESAICCVGMAPGGKIWVLDEWGKRGALPREQVDMFFDFIVRWEPDVVGVETTAYQAALVHLLTEEMFRKKVYFEIKKIQHTKKKNLRIQGILEPRYASGYMRHARMFPELEMQLEEYQRDIEDQPDDRIDAETGAISLLDDFASDVGLVEGREKSEYPPLEEHIGGEWRAI